MRGVFGIWMKMAGKTTSSRHACLERCRMNTSEKTGQFLSTVSYFADLAPTVRATIAACKRGGPSETDKMKIKIDSETGRHMISRRFATVAPVFGNLRGNKQLSRFTLRGKAKWKLYCLMHNIEKLAHHGYAMQ